MPSDVFPKCLLQVYQVLPSLLLLIFRNRVYNAATKGTEVLPSQEGTRGSRYKLHWERFHLDARNRVFRVRTIYPWNNLARDVESQSLEVFQVQLNQVRDNLIQASSSHKRLDHRTERCSPGCPEALQGGCGDGPFGGCGCVAARSRGAGRSRTGSAQNWNQFPLSFSWQSKSGLCGFLNQMNYGLE